jgi:hypothetical protein
MAEKTQGSSSPSMYSPIGEDIYDLFMETRAWAIDNNYENPMHTAIMRVAIEALLRRACPPLWLFRDHVASLVVLAKKVEVIGGGVALASHDAEKKMAEIRQRMEPFGIFEDACEGSLTAEGVAKMTSVSARIVEVVARFFGKDVGELNQKSEDFLRWLSSEFGNTMAHAEDLAKSNIQYSLDSLGTHLQKAADELREGGSTVARQQALDLEMVGGWASAVAHAMDEPPPAFTVPTLVSGTNSEIAIKKTLTKKPSLVIPYYVTLPDSSSQGGPPKASHAPQAGTGITIGTMTLAGATGYGISMATSSGMTVGAGTTLQAVGVSIGGPIFPVVGMAAIGYQLVQFYNDFEVRRAYAFQQLTPITAEEEASARADLLRLYGIPQVALTAAQIAPLHQYIGQLHMVCQELANATRRTLRRKKTSWGGSFVRCVASRIGGGDSGTVRSAQKMEKECRTRIDDLQRQINEYLTSLKSTITKKK